MCLKTETEFEYGVENLHNLMMNEENEIILEHYLFLFINQFASLLLSNYGDVVERVLEVICHFSDMKMETRITLAKTPELINRIVLLIAGNSAKNPEKISRLGVLILKNLCVTPSTHSYIKPFESTLFLMSTSNTDMYFY